MAEFLMLPNPVLLGVIAVLAIASIAGWSCSDLSRKVRRLERQTYAMRHEIYVLRHELDAQQKTAASRASAPIFEPLYQRGQHGRLLPSEPDAVWERGRRPLPDVGELARQIGAQSPESIQQLLSGQVSLSTAAQELGTGRQEARLIQWLHGTPEARQQRER